jgi:hypothetical protein
VKSSVALCNEVELISPATVCNIAATTARERSNKMAPRAMARFSGDTTRYEKGLGVRKARGLD